MGPPRFRCADVEMDALMRNETWDKCILPQGKKPVGCHRIFTIKYKPDVVKIDTIRVLFSIAANQGWPLYQFNVKNAFLHEELKEEVYMEALPGFSQHFKHGEVWDIHLSKIYILDLLAETGMVDCKPDDTTMITNQKLFMKTKAKLANRDRRSTSGYFSLVGGNLVTWKSKKQKFVSLLSVEAEFRGIAKGLAESLWIRKLVFEIGFLLKESIRIMSDNKATIQILENPMQHDRTKHVEVDRHFIKEKLEAEIINLPFVKSEDQLADILTKAVGMAMLHKCLNKVNFGDPTI
uniref:Putative copia-type protein n=1 Tax=Tanacetum cinerariifolium TaxID=118510 RepID=A0A699H7R1_TANCI|nr:putative copia-type protein [Tanacetum cinerariifolium]